MDLMAAMRVSGSGMKAQSMRMKVISENIANSQSLLSEDGGPYRRQTVYFQSAVDAATGQPTVKLAAIRKDYATPLNMTFEPNHPLADERGFVARPNVDTQIEAADMREAARAYEANMSAISTVKDMVQRSIDLMR